MVTRRVRTARGVTRRTALATALGAGASVAACAGDPGPRGPAPRAPFLHGVASGDPRPDRVIIWTRVTPETDSTVSVRWDMARDAGFADIVKSGAATASPGGDWTVKVDVTGLAAGARYFYRFMVGGEASPIGRTSTLPTGPIERFSMAALSCSNYPAGYFNVYRDVAARALAGEVDLVVHLGDYLYEYGAGEYATAWGEKNDRAPQPRGEVVTLADYRARHAQYKSDPDLQAAHGAAPWMTVWDDHETTNNAWRGGAQNHQPETEGTWDVRKAAALRAYYEWMPVRDPEPGRPREAIWRAAEIGDLASLILLETRLSGRDREVFWADAPVPADADPNDAGARAALHAWLRDTVGAPDRQLLGAEQEAWVQERLAASTAAGKPWQILGNQVLLGRIIAPNYVARLPGWLKWVIRRQFPEAWDVILRTQFDVPANLDQWDGYEAARERLYAAVQAAGANLVALTGDTHCFYTNRLTRADGAQVGWELGTSSVSSPSEFNMVTAPGVDFGALTEERNPDVLLHSAYDRGWVRLELRRDRAEAEYIRINTVTSRRYTSETIHRYHLTPQPEGGTTLQEV